MSGPLLLPPQGGNIDLLTQPHWPTVHPALQEPRPSAPPRKQRSEEDR